MGGVGGFEVRLGEKGLPGEFHLGSAGVEIEIVDEVESVLGCSVEESVDVDGVLMGSEEEVDMLCWVIVVHWSVSGLIKRSFGQLTAEVE